MENENNTLNLTSIRIKQMRLEKNWTQKDLSKKLGLKNDTAIANYEAGYSTPKDDIKLKMCEIFNCSLDYLMGKSDIRNPEKININDVDVAFASGVKALNKTNKMIIKNTLEALLAKQEQDNKNTEDK